MTTFASADLLTILPNAVTRRTVRVDRPVDRSENPQGNVVTTSTEADQTLAFDHEWVCETRADLALLTDFLDARQGRLVACWIPTYQRDIERLDTSGGWHVRYYGPADLDALVNTTDRWRYWYSLMPGRSGYAAVNFNTAVDNGDGTHLWSAAPGTGWTAVGAGTSGVQSAGGAMFSRLIYCRMAEDQYRVEYIARATRVTASFVELPSEYPT